MVSRVERLACCWLAVEELFRAGKLRVVVATSAFGEGIDLPDVRHVVLYHLNFNLTEFNQQAGRAGRNGAPARIHLLYGRGDRRINEFIIARTAPSLDTLRAIYRGIRELARDGTLQSNADNIARTLGIELVEGETIGAALRIFEESGLLRAERAVRTLIATRLARCERDGQLLAAFSYRGVLARGFALIRDAAGQPLHSVAAAVAGMPIQIEFSDGRVGARVDGSSSADTPDEPTKPRAKRGGGAGQGDLF